MLSIETFKFFSRSTIATLNSKQGHSVIDAKHPKAVPTLLFVLVEHLQVGRRAIKMTKPPQREKVTAASLFTFVLSATMLG